jgi:hypothetical protein
MVAVYDNEESWDLKAGVPHRSGKQVELFIMDGIDTQVALIKKGSDEVRQRHRCKHCMCRSFPVSFN